MRKLNGFKWLYVLAVMVATANADIIIDNQAIPSADISSISISPDTGNIFVATFPGYTVTKNVVGDNVAITRFDVTPPTITAGGSATLNWTTANADNCTASGGVGEWAGSTIGTSGQKVITTPPVGSHTFILRCTGQVGEPVDATTSLTVNAVSITSFKATPEIITAGQSTTLSWVTNATSCTPSGGGTSVWSSLSLSVPNGSKQITLTTAGSYTFTLTCGTAEKFIEVTVNPAGGQCTTPPLTGTVTPTQWKSFWQVDFPKPTYDNRYATVPRTGYLALQFNTGIIVSNGKLSTIETTTTDGIRFGAISQCPGDFDVAPECYHRWGISGGISWSTNGASGCKLAPNTTYYFNLTYTDGVDPETTTCKSPPCITTLQNSNR